MSSSNRRLAASALFSLAFGASVANATTISLGASSENYVLYGQGAYAPGLGTFTNQQGAETNTSTTTDILEGMITGSSSSALNSGFYTLYTTYSGTPIGSGGSEIQSYSIASSPNEFSYYFLDPSLDMPLVLTDTPSGSYTLPLITNGSFDGPGFSFAYTTATCTGVSSCSQNEVGLTPGATISGPVTISVSFADLPPPTPSVPEPATWAMMLAGMGAIGFAMRRRAKVNVSYA